MADEVAWAAVEVAYATGVHATVQVPVVAGVLGKGFLEQRSPECLIRASLGVGEPVRCFVEGQIVVYVGRIGDAECVDLHAVHSRPTHFRVVEDVVDSLWVFSHSAERGYDPAVPDLTLGHIGWSDTAGSPKRVARVLLTYPQPLDVSSLLRDDRASLVCVVRPIQPI